MLRRRMPSPILPWVKNPSSSGPRWAITSHIRRRTLESTCASAPNSSIPAMPHISFFYPNQLPFPTSDSGSRVQNFEISNSRIAQHGSSGRKCFLRSGMAQPLELSVRDGCETKRLPCRSPKLLETIITWVNRPRSSLRWNNLESLAQGPYAHRLVYLVYSSHSDVS